jgi:hypothetical protein
MWNASVETWRFAWLASFERSIVEFVSGTLW